MKTVQINTDQENKYISGDRASGHTVNVTPDKHWDKLSKIFKKYKYAIEYNELDRDSEYTISVFAKGSRSSFFIFKNPELKVEAVEVYFKGDHDIKKEEPLIVRFIYQREFVLEGGEDDCQSNKSSKCYYAWSKLKNQQKTSTIDGVEPIKEKDLVTVLLEEIGLNIRRTNKLVIRLDEQPRDFEHILQYPDSGHYSKGGNRKITVSKVENTVVPGVEGYEHRIDTSLNLSEFYVSYLNNNRYFKTGSGLSGQHLDKVTAYFKSGTGSSKNLVLITFSFKKGSGKHSAGDTLYVYSYQDFVKELNEVTADQATKESAVKTIDKSEAITDDGGGSGSGLKKRLEQEKENLEALITFLNDDRYNNENISGQLELIYQDGNEELTFIKFTLRPTSAEDKPDGSSGGPWKVVNNKLFTLESSMKMPEELLDVITTSESTTKYRSITVYYTSNDNSNYKALLVYFHTSDGRKIYFKRTNEVGSSWDGEYGISTGGAGVSEEKLTQIATDAGIIVVSSPREEAGSGTDSGSNGALGPAVGSVTAILGAGGGAGFAIYKYPQFFLSLIRR